MRATSKWPSSGPRSTNTGTSSMASLTTNSDAFREIQVEVSLMIPSMASK
jgi:hypothetical protein